LNFLDLMQPENIETVTIGTILDHPEEKRPGQDIDDDFGMETIAAVGGDDDYYLSKFSVNHPMVQNFKIRNKF
jgi:hypothetical protein